MKHSTLILGVLFFGGAIAACDSGGAEYVKQMESFAEKTCACADMACATKVQQENADWLSKNAEQAAKLDADDAEKITAAGTKMAECTTKLATKAAGG